MASDGGGAAPAVVLTVPVELSAVVADALREDLLRSAGVGSDVVLDLRATRLCDVEALGALLQLAAELRADGMRAVIRSGSDLLQAMAADFRLPVLPAGGALQGGAALVRRGRAAGGPPPVVRERPHGATPPVL